MGNYSGKLVCLPTRTRPGILNPHIELLDSGNHKYVAVFRGKFDVGDGPIDVLVEQEREEQDSDLKFLRRGRGWRNSHYVFTDLPTDRALMQARAAAEDKQVVLYDTVITDVHCQGLNEILYHPENWQPDYEPDTGHKAA